MKRCISLVSALILLSGFCFAQPGEPYTTTDAGGINLPVSPVRYSSNIQLPLNTHSWFSNLYFDGNNWADGDYPNMISLIADPLTVHFDKGSGGPSIAAMNLQFVYNAGPANPHFRCVHEAADAITVETNSGVPGEPMIDAYSDWGLKVTQDGGRLETSSYNGSPFVNFTSTDGFKLITKLPCTVWYNEGNVIGIESSISFYDSWGGQWVNWNDSYVIYGPSGSTWSTTADGNNILTITSSQGGSSYCSIASLPNEKDEAKKIQMLEYLKDFAFNFITDTKVSWKYDRQNAKVITTFTATFDKKEGNNNKLLYALYPHQWMNFDGKIEDVMTFNSARGPMKLHEAENGTFSTEIVYSGVLPHFPLVADAASGYDEAELQGMVQGVIDSGEGNNVFQGNTAYATSVTVGRTAQVIKIADQVGLTADRDTLLNWVRRSVENWLSYTGGEDNTYLYYDTNYGALIAAPPESGMFSDAHLNDAHFQFGYILKAASIIAEYDPEWVKVWGDRVELLIKYVSNWKRDEKEFPFLRFMDPYQGHSWATGDADFRDGNNQESSSEAMNYMSAVALWGMVTGNDEIIDLGAYLYATEAEGTLQYWWDIYEETYPHGPDHGDREHAIFEAAEYKYPMSGFVFGDKSDFSTWFGSEQTGYQEYPVGINLLPMTAASTYLAREPEYVKKNLIDWFLNKYGKVNRWNELFWTYLALADPQRALGFYNSERWGETQPSPPTETPPHYYHWIHNLAAMGPYRSDITANTPSYSVFGEGDNKTYVAYNPSSSDIKVTFSDGAVLKVPAGELYASKEVTKLAACIQAPADEALIMDNDNSGSEMVTLDGSCSFYSEGGVSSYSWKVDGVVVGTSKLLDVDLAKGKHTIELTVTAAGVNPDSEMITVHVTAGEPIADAGEDKAVNDEDGDGAQDVVLDASKSLDPVGNIVSYEWSEAGTVLSSDEVATVSLAVGEHVLLLTVVDDNANEATDEVVVVVRPEVAQGGTVTASSTSEGTPANVIDKDESTQWISAERNQPEWLLIDLAESKGIAQVDVVWDEATFATAYEVQVSNDASFATFSTLASITDGDGATDALVAPANTAGRYVRIFATESNGAVKKIEDSHGNFVAVVSSIAGSAPTVTFEPTGENIGTGFCYIDYSVNGNYVGSYPAKPNEPFTINNVADGDSISFKYKYTLPSNAQEFGDDMSFVVGNVNGGSVYAIKEVKVFGGNSGAKASEAVAKKSMIQHIDVEVYPNPAVDELRIPTLPETATIRVFDCTGAFVMERRGNKLNTERLTSGTYFLLTSTGAKAKFVKK